MMHEANVNDRHVIETREGFTLAYVCDSYDAVVAFSDQDCSSIISNIVSFLISCGYAPATVIDCMAETAENLDIAWGTGKKMSEEIDPEIVTKWRLSGKEFD